MEEADWVRALPKDYDFSFYKKLLVYKPLCQEEEIYISLLYQIRDILLDIMPSEIDRSYLDIAPRICKIEEGLREFGACVLRLSEAWRYQDYDAIHCSLLEIYEVARSFKNEIEEMDMMIYYLCPLLPDPPEGYYDIKFFDEVVYDKN